MIIPRAVVNQYMVDGLNCVEVTRIAELDGINLNVFNYAYIAFVKVRLTNRR